MKGELTMTWGYLSILPVSEVDMLTNLCLQSSVLPAVSETTRQEYLGPSWPGRPHQAFRPPQAARLLQCPPHTSSALLKAAVRFLGASTPLSLQGGSAFRFVVLNPKQWVVGVESEVQRRLLPALFPSNVKTWTWEQSCYLGFRNWKRQAVIK